jgi:hypothetical protein
MHAKMSRLLRRLLLQIRLNTPLPRLSIIMLPLRLSLLRIIPSQTRDRTTNRTSNTVWKALAQVIDLSSSLLFLALRILLLTRLLEVLGANKAADSFLCGTDVLVPWAFCAIWVVFCDTAWGGDGEGAGFGGCVGEVLFRGCDVLLVLALDLGTD